MLSIYYRNQNAGPRHRQPGTNLISRSIHMDEQRSPMFTIALIIGIAGALGFFLLAAAVANGGM